MSSSDNDSAHYPPPPGAGDEDDDWFQPITYDTTAYDDLDQYLALESSQDEGPFSRPDAEEPGFPTAGPGPYSGWPRGYPPGKTRGYPPRKNRPRWLLPAVAAIAAAGLGFGLVMLTGRANDSLPSSALPASPGMPRGAGGPATGASPGARTPGMTPASGGMAATPGMTSGTPAGSAPPGGMAPAITQAQAQQVLASYTGANNMANAQASDSLIGSVETGSSVAIDSGIYQAQRASGGDGYPAYGPVSAAYYIPLESPGGFPHWFAVQVKNALLADPGKVINGEYLIFTQAFPGAPWLDAAEPFILPGAQPPAIALDANGYATAVTPNDAGLLLSPGAASGATATALDAGTGQPASPGNLADQQGQASLRRQISPGSGLTDAHSAAPFPLFGLRTSDSGALLFYTVAARLTVTAPQGSALSLNVPGFVSAGQQATAETLDYLEQFATYDPARGQGTSVPVIADYSGLTGTG